MNVRLEWFNRIVALFLIALICSCSMSMSGPESLSERLLVARSARLMELYLDEVSRALTDEELPGFREAYERGFSAEDVARRTLEEENGRKYLEFTLYSDDYQDVDEVLSAASALVPEEELSTIKSNIKELEERLYEGAEEESRVMTAAQKKAFYSELRKLVVKAAVLLTAAIVYACVPNLMFWGKVSAASAVAIAAGVLAATLMSILEYAKTGTSSVTFEEWVKEITSEPAAAWALASGLIATNTALGRSPVTAAIIIAVFAIYGIIDDIKPLLSAYKK